jgi:uncharacterized protein YjiK
MGLMLLCSSCKTEAYRNNNRSKTSSSKATSELETPENNRQFLEVVDVFVLDRELSEISGLSFNKQSSTLFAINDEKGILYEVNKETGDIMSSSKFHRKGDYEAIEVVNDTAFIAKNNGNLYQFNFKNRETKVFKTSLTVKNDIEGLSFEDQTACLLLACKGDGSINNRKTKSKSIYRFCLKDQLLNPEPLISLDIDTLISFVKNQYKKLGPLRMGGFVNRIKTFSPSGIAIHPINRDIYIVSAKGSSLVILDSKTIPQPEGICFDQKPYLYISTEGQGYSGKIFKYDIKKN